MRPKTIKRSLTGLLAAAVIASGCATLAKAAPATSPVRLDKGHTDIFNVSYADNKLDLKLKEDITGSSVIRDPKDVVLVVKEQALKDIPEGYPGAPKGYLLPLTQDQNLLWPGWDTQGVKTAGEIPVDIDISKVDGPGTVYMFSQEPFGTGPKSLLTSGGYTLPGTIHQNPPAHTHTNWVFSKPGLYKFYVKASATINGKKLSSPERVYTWEVGNIPQPTPPSGNDPKPPQPNKPKPSVSPTPGKPAKPVPTTPGAKPSPAAQPSGNKPAKPADKKTETVCSPVKITSRTNKSVVTSGHFDLGAQLVDGELQSKLKDDRVQPAKWNTPSSYLFVLDDSAKKSLPGGYSFIGSAGTQVWMIGSTQISGVPWLGINTQHPSIVNGTSGSVKWDLVSVDGPGKMFTFFSGSLGAGAGERVFDNANGPKSYTVSPNTHAHPNWVFTKPGNYDVVIRQSTTLPSGKRVSSTTTLHFAVGASADSARTTKITVYRDQNGKPCSPAGRQAFNMPNTGV